MRTSKYLIVAVALFGFSGSLAAKKNNPDITLEYRPQQSVAATVANVSGAMLERPVALRFEDDRQRDDPSVIGSRTDDDDRKIALRATSDLLEFVRDNFRSAARDWGVRFDSDAGLTLVVRVLETKITETNQAVGATYNAVVRLAYALESGSGEKLVSNTALGDASRYGKKFSNDNCNEVLSDAMLEAFANLVSDRELQRAWGK